MVLNIKNIAARNTIFKATAEDEQIKKQEGQRQIPKNDNDTNEAYDTFLSTNDINRFPAAQNYFIFPVGQSTPTPAKAYMLMPRAGTLKNLYVMSGVNTFNGNSKVIIYKEGVQTDLLVTYTARQNATKHSNTTDKVVVNAGDRISIDVDSTDSTSGEADFMVSVEFNL